MYDFLLVRHCNYSSILYRLRVIKGTCLYAVARYTSLLCFQQSAMMKTDAGTCASSSVSLLTTSSRLSNHFLLSSTTPIDLVRRGSTLLCFALRIMLRSLANIIYTVLTRSSAVANRPLDASCLGL